MKGLVIINGYPNGEKFYRQGNRIATELQLLGVEACVVKNGDIFAWQTECGGCACALSNAQNSPLRDCTFAVYLDKDKYLGKMLQSVGLRLFNSAEAVEICDDKMTTYLSLQNAGLRIPCTIPAPLCYTNGAAANADFLRSVGERLGFPLVAKTSYGSFGAGVRLIHGMPELQKTEEEWQRQPHFYQQYIAEAAGEDLRVIVVGGKAIGCMRRRAQKGEFRSNIELGGVGEYTPFADEYRFAAERAAQALGLDYCGVDLLQTKDGPVLCEVNSNAFFEGFEGVTGINVAKAYAEHIVQELSKK